MPMIPERAPIGDVVQGMVIQHQAEHAFFAAEEAVLPTDLTILARGTLVIRYAVRLLEKPKLSLVPGLLALDYGEILTGEAAWDFLLKKSNLYPRADVVGYRSDGVDEMLPVKRLDLALPIEVLAYSDPQATKPVASLSALILPAAVLETERAALPLRLTQHLPVYDGIAAWQQHLSALEEGVDVNQ